jgi:hypothetical protein
MAQDLFKHLDFDSLSDTDFKEDSVREVVIMPLLNALGYGVSSRTRIIRSRGLTNPYVNLGSKRLRIRMIPDYLLEVDEKFAWVLDAKSPSEQVMNEEHLEQIYSYSIHPDVRVNLYALCNGREFILFQLGQRDPVLYFQLSELEQHWDELMSYLSPEIFESQGKPTLRETRLPPARFDYLAAKPPREIKDTLKQSAKRHYGVHGYFTKQVWNVVQEYIKVFTQPGDTVLDPFGGSGITAIEALVLGRKSIHIDINPLSVFLVDSLLATVDINKFADEYRNIRALFESNAPKTEHQIEEALRKYSYPKRVTLPGNSDVNTVEELFTREQLAQLAFLKHLIKRVKDENIRKTLMLMFSGLLSQINLTFHASEGRSEGRGNNSMFQYYRYRIAPRPSKLDILERLDLRFRKVLAAKRELALAVSQDLLASIKVYKGSATNLQGVPNESVDYIYTDPP